MNANPKMINAIKTLNIPYSWLEYKGNAQEYIVFNDTLNAPTIYADNCDVYDEQITQVHYYTKNDPVANLKLLKQALRNEGFTILETLVTRDSFTLDKNEGLIHCMVKVSIVGDSD